MLIMDRLLSTAFHGEMTGILPRFVNGPSFGPRNVSQEMKWCVALTNAFSSAQNEEIRIMMTLDHECFDVGDGQQNDFNKTHIKRRYHVGLQCPCRTLAGPKHTKRNGFLTCSIKKQPNSQSPRSRSKANANSPMNALFGTLSVRQSNERNRDQRAENGRDSGTQPERST